MNPDRFLKYAKLINLYPPYLGAGIRLTEVSETGNRFVVTMRQTWFNKNINGTHFGGSLYSMCDPFYVFAAHAVFKKDYILWDKSACIKYVRPGKGKVKGVFEIPMERLHEMKAEVDEKGKMLYTFETVITDEQDKVVAEIEKTIYVKKKSA